MLNEEWLSDHKAQIGLDAVCVAALTFVLISETSSSGKLIQNRCGVDPYAQCL
jgi:hypothetical protein